MGDGFLNNTFVSDKANQVSAKVNNPKAEDRQEHTELISAIKVAEREGMKH